MLELLRNICLCVAKELRTWVKCKLCAHLALCRPEAGIQERSSCVVDHSTNCLVASANFVFASCCVDNTAERSAGRSTEP